MRKRAGRWLTAVAGWAVVGGQRIYFRSKFERAYAERLELLRSVKVIASWEHEPKRFDFPIKRGTNSYLPDFRVTYHDGRVEWHEVKGWFDAKSRTQIRRFRKYFPGETLVVIGSKGVPVDLESLVKRRNKTPSRDDIPAATTYTDR